MANRRLHADAQALVYGHDREARTFGVVFALIGAGVATGGALSALGVIRLGVLGWLALVVGVLFVLAGLTVATHRDRLTIDLRERTWSWRRGVPGWTRVRRGTFMDIDAVGLHRETRRSGRVARLHVDTRKLRREMAGVQTRLGEAIYEARVAGGDDLRLSEVEGYAGGVAALDSLNEQLHAKEVEIEQVRQAESASEKMTPASEAIVEEPANG